MKTQNKKGFTLIELLVVISIIALLLSILMPALSAVKKRAQQVVCMANLAQWGLVLTLYTEDHNSHFFAGYYDYTDPNDVIYTSTNSDLWPYALQSYYQTPKLKFCPSSGFSRRGRSGSTWGSKSDEIFSGSYGLNGWLGDTPEEVIQTEGHDTSDSWRTMDYYGSSKIPLMADAIWYTGRPESHDLPPKEEGQLDDDESQSDMDSDDWPNDPSNHMRRFSVNRHKGKLNVLFMDGMVKTISPKELWQLKWHKDYDTSAPLPEWPEWMASFKDPD
jgi:prepilin-type N-terminal cleavage/methylation domain-containing protein/prepilin-type processing-associated H-X9-DG protein